MREESSRGRSAEPGRGASDSSTENVELGALVESRSTGTALGDGAPEPRERLPVDANVILIAHPEGKLLGSRYRLAPGSTLEIGRSPACAVSLPEVLSISRAHARLLYEGSAVWIDDLGSTNGTYVNGGLLHERRRLRSGDRFQVGAVHFKLLHERDVEHAYHEAIYNLVVRDGLTETFNKRKYDEESDREVARALRYERPLALVLFDLDHFKAVNDTYGHLAGDFVLKALADRVRESLRVEQILARVGGEEFAVLCPETTLAGGVAVAEKLRLLIEGLELHYLGCTLRVTCSFGVAALEAPMRTSGELYAAADRALYQSKQTGRNRVTGYAGDAAPPA
jgi:diguanylate cyclase (GGDEF)-like protein